MTRKDELLDIARKLHERDLERVLAALQLITNTPELEVHRTDGSLVRALAVARADLLDALQASNRELRLSQFTPDARGIAFMPYVITYPAPIEVVESQDAIRIMEEKSDRRVIEAVADWIRYRHEREPLIHPREIAEELEAGAPWNDEEWRGDRYRRFVDETMAGIVNRIPRRRG